MFAPPLPAAAEGAQEGFEAGAEAAFVPGAVFLALELAGHVFVADRAFAQAAGDVGIGVFGGEAAGLPGELEIVDCIARSAGGAVFPAFVGAHESQARTGLVCAIESRSVRHSRTL